MEHYSLTITLNFRKSGHMSIYPFLKDNCEQAICTIDPCRILNGKNEKKNYVSIFQGA